MYPIRVSRPVWTQPFLKPHTCSELCHTQYEIQNTIIRITYQTGCMFPENIEPLHIHISDHNETEITYINSILNIPNEVILCIDHPLRYVFRVVHVFEQVVIRLSDVIQVFDHYYNQIYKEEEEGSTHREFLIEKECPDCTDEHYTDEHLPEFLNVVNTEESCSICFENVHLEGDTNIYAVRNCGHLFHYPCILKWFKTPKIINDEESLPHTNSCPICRQSIIFCDTCKGSRVIKESYFGSVPPYDPNSEEDRIETDGPHRIHTIYYEELYFKGIQYDRIHNTLSLLPLEQLDD